MDGIGTIVTLVGQWVPVALAVVGVFSLIANITPTQTDNKVVDFVGKVVNFLAGYWNDPDAKKPTPTPPTV
jgi:hypothetical protein